MELIVIPGNFSFTMGLEARQAESIRAPFEPSPFPYYREMPAHPVRIAPYRLAETPVTNAEYLEFVEADGYALAELWQPLMDEPELDGKSALASFTDQTAKPGPLTWRDGRPVPGTGDHPVSGVSWYEATAYCRFRGLRLPTEAEWELGARGEDELIYPWGNEFDPTRCAHGGWPQSGTVPVDSMPEGSSPWGLRHMSGNVAQWCEDLYAPYPGSLPGGRAHSPLSRVVRGDFYRGTPESLRATVRSPQSPDQRFPGLGFRCAADYARPWSRG